MQEGSTNCYAPRGKAKKGILYEGSGASMDQQIEIVTHFAPLTEMSNTSNTLRRRQNVLLP